MYEPIIKLWKGYGAKHSVQWTNEDPRHGLFSEVQKRLNQLNLVLSHLGASIGTVTGDPEENRQHAERCENARLKWLAGEITEEEFFTIVVKPSSVEQKHQYMLAWDEVHLFTEMFYLVAWRLMEVLNRKGPLAFPNLRKIDSRGIREVRNHLIQHPEGRKQSPDYRQSLVLTDAGPVLKTSEIWIDFTTGRTRPVKESLDRGLYVHAKEFYCDLEACLTHSLSL